MRQPLLLNSTKLYLIWFLTPLIVIGCNQVKNEKARPAPAAKTDAVSESAESTPLDGDAKSVEEAQTDAGMKLEGVPEDVDVATYELIRELTLIWGSEPTQSQTKTDGEKR